MIAQARRRVQQASYSARSDAEKPASPTMPLEDSQTGPTRNYASRIALRSLVMPRLLAMGSADEPGRGKTTVTRGCEGLSASLSRCAYRLRFCLSGHEPALGWRPPVGVGWRVQRFSLCTFHKAEKDHSGRDAG